MPTDTEQPITIDTALTITREAIDRTNERVADCRRMLAAELIHQHSLRKAERQLLDLQSPSYTWVTMDARDVICGDVIQWPGQSVEERVNHTGRTGPNGRRVELGTDQAALDYEVDGWYPVRIRHPRPVVTADVEREAINA